MAPNRLAMKAEDEIPADGKREHKDGMNADAHIETGFKIEEEE